jgi:hypothetical protein
MLTYCSDCVQVTLKMQEKTATHIINVIDNEAIFHVNYLWFKAVECDRIENLFTFFFSFSVFLH